MKLQVTIVLAALIASGCAANPNYTGARTYTQGMSSSAKSENALKLNLYGSRKKSKSFGMPDSLARFYAAERIHRECQFKHPRDMPSKTIDMCAQASVLFETGGQNNSQAAFDARAAEMRQEASE